MPFNLSGIGKGLGESLGESLGTQLKRIISEGQTAGRVLHETPIPPAGQRGTPEAPTLAVRAEEAQPPHRTFAPSVSTQTLDEPYRVDPKVEHLVSQTLDASRSIEDRLQDVKTIASSFIEHTPNQPKDIQDLFLDTRTKHDGADDKAAVDVAEWLSPIGGRPTSARDATLLFRQLKMADIIRDMEDDGLDEAHGIPIDKWRAENQKMISYIESDAGLQQASANVRAGLDEMWDTMVARGWISPDRYKENYTPLKKINDIYHGLGSFTGETAEQVKSRVLRSMKSRGENSTGGVHESNMLQLIYQARKEMLQKIATDDMFAKILADKTLNFTDRYKDHQGPLPRGLKVYNPGKGMVGYTLKTGLERDQMQVLEDMGLTDENTITPGGYILPAPLVDALNHFHPPRTTDVEAKVSKGGQLVARSMTVYNPANTLVNIPGDLFTALMGMPGEKANAIGFLRFLRDGKNAAEAVRRGERYIMEIEGRKIDVTKMVEEANLLESTLVEDLSGRKFKPVLGQFTPEEEIKTKGGPINAVKNFLEESRQDVELGPRIAYGLAALQATGNVEEFGRVAREITLNYGAGAPKLSKVPLLRFMSPFLSYAALSTKRTLQLATTKGSRARGIAALTALPLAITAWNNQNEEFRAVLRSTGANDRTNLKLILMDPLHWGRVWRDEKGRPIIIRCKFFLTETAMQLAGLGNLPDRVIRVAEGRDTIGDFAQTTLKSSLAGIAGTLLTVPQSLGEAAIGRSALTGKQMTWRERAERLMPGIRAPWEAATDIMGGIAEENPFKVLFDAGRYGMRDVLGLNPVYTYEKGGYIMDSDVIEAAQAFRDARNHYKSAAATGDRDDIRQAYSDMMDAADKYKKAAQTMRKVMGDERAREQILIAEGALKEGDPKTREWDPEAKQEAQITQSERVNDIVTDFWRDRQRERYPSNWSN